MNSANVTTVDICAMLAALQERLVAADALGEACLRAVASGAIAPDSDLANAAASYTKVVGRQVVVSEDIAVHSAWFCDEPILLAPALREQFFEGFRFRVAGRRIEPGWVVGNSRSNLVVEFVEFDGQEAVAIFESEEDQLHTAQRELENKKRVRLAKLAKEKLLAARLVFDRKLCIPIQREYDLQLNPNGRSELNAYLDRIALRRFPNSVVAYMVDGATIAEAGPRASDELVQAFRKKAEAMTKQIKYRSGTQ